MIINFFIEMRGYLTEGQIAEVKSFLSNRLTDVLYHYWIREEFSSLDWIEFIFSDGRKLAFTSGDIGEDIHIVDYSKHSISLQGEYELKSESKIDAENWRELKNEALIDLEITDNGYCNGSLILFFNKKKVEILALMDSVTARFN